MGIPYSLNGETGTQAKRALVFAKALRKQTSLPVHGTDERYTSVEAEALMREATAEALLGAAAAGDASELESVLSSELRDGESVDVVGESGRTPLHLACSCGSLPAIERLLARGDEVVVLAGGAEAEADIDLSLIHI